MNWLGQSVDFIAGICATIMIVAFFLFVWVFSGKDAHIDEDTP